MTPPSVKPRGAQGPTAAPGRAWAAEHSPQPPALLVCSPVLLLRGKGRPQRTKAGEDRCRACRVLLGDTVHQALAVLPWCHQKHFFFFPLVRETRPPWQSADSLETHKDRRRGEGKERESRKKSPSPKPRCQSPSGKAQDRQAVGARVPSHRGPLSPAHGAGGWGWGPGTRGCGALLHPLGWFRDPLPPNHFGRPSSLLPRT